MQRTPAIVLMLALAACAGGSAVAPATTPTAPSATARASDTPAPTPSVAVTFSPEPLSPVAELLPTELDGVEAHTFAVMQDLVGRLAAVTGVPIEELETAYASEHGARFIQMVAVRAPGVSPDEMLAALGEVAYPPRGTGEPEIGSDTLAGVEVVVVSDSELDARLGTFYGLVRGGALIVIEAFERDAAEVAVDALP